MRTEHDKMMIFIYHLDSNTILYLPTYRVFSKLHNKYLENKVRSEIRKSHDPFESRHNEHYTNKAISRENAILHKIWESGKTTIALHIVKKCEIYAPRKIFSVIIIWSKVL